MKKIIAITITLLIISTCAYSESNSYVPDIQWDMLSDDDIHSIINTATDILNSRAQLTNVTDPTIYYTKEIKFSIVGPYLYHGIEHDYVILGYNWTNILDKPTSFSYKLISTGYQNGIEVYDFFPLEIISKSNHSTNILPNHILISYDAFSISDDSEIVIVIEDFNFPHTMDPISINSSPSDLPIFE